MPLASLLNIPANEDGWSHFSFNNQDEHRQISAALRARGITSPDVLLDPIPFQDIGAWSYVHQQSHDIIASALGIQGSDFTTVDFSKPDQVASWIRLHFESHLQANNVLELS